jgi:hypothetical protein
MNNYKKTIKKRILLLTVPIILAVSLGVYDVFWASEQIKATSIYGFQVGIIISIGLLATILVIHYRVLLKDKGKLLLQFNRENDERIKAIKAKAGIPMLPITSILIIIAGVIAGYFDTLVFITLIAAAVFQMTICGIVKVIYMKKM